MILFIPSFKTNDQKENVSTFQYTQNGKKVEVAVKKIISKETVSNRGAYANPASLDLYENIPELQGF